MPISHAAASHYENTYSHHVAFGVEWRKIGAQDKARNIRSLCAGFPHHSILEIGCGDGAIIRELKDFGEEITGLEISQAAVEQCVQAGLSVALFDGSTIPCNDKSVDLAILSHVVEHLENPRELLYEAARVARYVFVEVPLEDNRGLKMDFVPNDVGHINFYSAKTIRQLLQTCRLELRAQKLSHSTLAGYRYRLGAKGYAAWGIKSAALLFPHFATKMWTYHCSLVAASNQSESV
jgi:2-polyprenyl-3-methyl-5-hydroxy-6-metoxy-1,4-benzoquinol methylase